MNILIVTQKVDVSDPILGFFHRWIEECSYNFENVRVIGQKVGNYNLPSNVSIYSLGKENGTNRFIQICRYWYLLYKLRNKYDAVLVHMTPIWVVLGIPSMILHRKSFYLWYEARGTRWPLRFSLFLPFLKKVFSASSHGMPIYTNKSVIVGHGIDTDTFTPLSQKNTNQLITVGRITKSKRLEIILEAFSTLSGEYHLLIIGQTITSDDQNYLKKIRKLILDKKIKNRVIIQSVTQKELLPLLRSSYIFLHASDTGLDKAVLEAMSCGSLVISCAGAVKPLLPDFCKADDYLSMSNAIESVLRLSNKEYENEAVKLRSLVVDNHGLTGLVKKLSNEMQKCDI